MALQDDGDISLDRIQSCRSTYARIARHLFFCQKRPYTVLLTVMFSLVVAAVEEEGVFVEGEREDRFIEERDNYRERQSTRQRSMRTAKITAET